MPYEYTPPKYAQVIDELRRRMMSGSLPPGTPIPEARLAGELRVSRGTMREALRRLQRGNELTSSIATANLGLSRPWDGVLTREHGVLRARVAAATVTGTPGGEAS